MGEEFSNRDLSEAVFWGVDLSRVHFRDVNLTGATMKNVWLIDTEIDGLVERLVINGVDVTDHINANDPWQPLRGMLRPTDHAGMLATWHELDRVWAPLLERARLLTDTDRHVSVEGEWSFTQTLRHLVFAIDKWFTVALDHGSFHPIGIPNTGSVGFAWPGLDPDADPSFDDTVAVRAERLARFHAFLESLTTDDVRREVEVLENGSATVVDCIYTVFEEEFEHHRYAVRDLNRLTQS